MLAPNQRRGGIMGRHPVRATLLVVAFLLASVVRAAPKFDWDQFADTQTVEVVTTDEDGGSRLTTVWIVVLDHQPYIRTSGTIWGDNVEREGKLRLRDGSAELTLRAEKVLIPSEVERVVAAFREKYGTTDAVMQIFRFGETRVFRLVE
jgi:Uncharacterized protein conserved in bacteria (DUF2255)